MAKRRVEIGHIAEIDPLGARVVKVEDAEIALFRLSDGEVRAVENRCPHKNGKLSEGMVCGHVVHCPLHDWKIDLNSGEALSPDEGCIDHYALEVDRATGKLILLPDDIGRETTPWTT